MGRSLAILFITLFNSAYGQDAKVIIKGHALGEPLQEFLATRPDGLNGKWNFYSSPHVNSLQDVLICRSQGLNKSLRRLSPYEADSVAKACRLVINAVDNGARFTINESGPDSVIFEFNKNKLVAVALSPYQLDFQDALRDMVARLGNPSSIDNIPVENGFGAVYKDPTALWETPQVHADLLSEERGTRRYCFIRIRLQEDVSDIKAEVQSNHKDALN